MILWNLINYYLFCIYVIVYDLIPLFTDNRFVFLISASENRQTKTQSIN
jgi:hypothetical protein